MASRDRQVRPIEPGRVRGDLGSDSGTATATSPEPGVPLTALVAAGALVAVQILVARLGGSVSLRSRRFQSLAGGLAVAYVFARLLPHLASSSDADARGSRSDVLALLQDHPFLVALAGLLAWFAVLDWAQDRDRRQQDGHGEVRIRWSFWTSVALYFVFNGFVGYLLVHQIRPGLAELAVYTVAISARYVTGELSLRRQDPQAYDRVVRWLLAAGVLVGWATGVALDVPAAVLNPLSALLTGSIILTSLHQQLPSPAQANFPIFGSACIAFTTLLLLL